jgi:integrase/recombinase XerD
MVRRRARDAGIETAIGNHSFRAIGITDYLERGGDINIAKRMAGHSNVKTTELYDRRGDEVSFSEIERVGIWTNMEIPERLGQIGNVLSTKALI